MAEPNPDEKVPAGDPVEVEVEDPIGAALGTRIEQTERLVHMHKARHTMAFVGEDEPAAIAELAAVTKLEISLSNQRSYERVRQLTRG
jgi:hypothetical protein